MLSSRGDLGSPKSVQGALRGLCHRSAALAAEFQLAGSSGPSAVVLLGGGEASLAELGSLQLSCSHLASQL